MEIELKAIPNQNTKTSKSDQEKSLKINEKTISKSNSNKPSKSESKNIEIK